MTSPFAAEGERRSLDYDQAWAPFDRRFHFRPDFYEAERPALTRRGRAAWRRRSLRTLVVDLSPVFADEGAGFEAGEQAVNAAALTAFVLLTGQRDLTALDWQHTPYRYSPAKHASAGLEVWPVPVFPNGDYYAHFPDGLAWGTFGHPWQQTLTLWGQPLIESLGAELLTWLPRHPQTQD